MLKSLQPLLTIIKREVKWMRKRWIYWFMTIVGPLLGFALVIGIFHKGVVRELPISIVNFDNSKTSRQVARMIDATPIANIKTSYSDLAEAQNDLHKGETEAIIVFPIDFEKKLFKSENPELVIYINNANIIKGGLLRSGILKAVSTFSSGVKFQISLKKGANTNQAYTEVLPINLDAHILFNPYTNYFYFLATALMSVIIIIFTLLSSIYSIGYELKYSTAKDALSKANNSIIVLVTGKLLPYTLLFFMQTTIANFLIFGIMDMPMSGSYFLLLVSQLLLILAYQFMAVFLVGIFGNMRLAVSIGSAYSMMALTFSGLTFPKAGMPVLAKVLSQFFPLTHWIKIFIGQTIRNTPVGIDLQTSTCLLVFIALGIFSMYWLKQKYSNKKYWAKN